MKNLKDPSVDKYRRMELERRIYAFNPAPQDLGVFVIERRGHPIKIIATSAMGWDHVSVSLNNRTPTWEEMEMIKRIFFEDHECAMQLHVPVADHKNHHPHCLHLWRPHDEVGTIPRPPSIMVAP